ncbi:SRPBCC family protein [Gordonia rhizosphera]|uniref:Polyketide cyclase/dehydrase n=1 Tax=Gordonia rhizosphera NBRC 16068 TaxID=1108045 RepID=K6UYA0_9ACTN|nr:SRPBCC family protein [Gordonia rhizosphera]GAB88393.1 hypothetical protein GORHZ_018_00540 [Gordonia rhizosphera NBRC 16068]
MTTSAKHTHSIHVDAPVEKVFEYIEVPGNIVAAMNAMPGEGELVLGEVDQKPDGEVADYRMTFRELGMHMHTTMTREEYMPNERITDHSSLGVDHMFSVAPEDTGTKLTYAWDATKLMRMIDATLFHTDKHIGEALQHVKKEVEALP